MPLSSTQDLLYLIAAIAVAAITVFLCWALYEVAKLIHQANAVVTDTREKIGRFERAVVSIGEKLGGVSTYLGLIAEGGKQLMSFLHTREAKKESRPKKKTKEQPLSDLPDEDEEEDES